MKEPNRIQQSDDPARDWRAVNDLSDLVAELNKRLEEMSHEVQRLKRLVDYGGSAFSLPDWIEIDEVAKVVKISDGTAGETRLYATGLIEQYKDDVLVVHLDPADVIVPDEEVLEYRGEPICRDGVDKCLTAVATEDYDCPA